MLLVYLLPTSHSTHITPMRCLKYLFGLTGIFTNIKRRAGDLYEMEGEKKKKHSENQHILQLCDAYHNTTE